MTSWTVNNSAVTPSWSTSHTISGAFQASAFQNNAFQTTAQGTSWTQNTNAVTPTWVVQ